MAGEKDIVLIYFEDKPLAFARIEGIEPGTCKVTFPRLDKEAWEKA